MKIGDDNISKKVKLLEYLTDNCPYQGCKYNELGTCIDDDVDFLNYIKDLVTDINTNKNKRIMCKVEFDENKCIYCGSYLIKVTEKHPYGDTTATEILYICPKC